jgi:hypothetical protein
MEIYFNIYFHQAKIIKLFEFLYIFIYIIIKIKYNNYLNHFIVKLKRQ